MSVSSTKHSMKFCLFSEKKKETKRRCTREGSNNIVVDKTRAYRFLWCLKGVAWSTASTSASHWLCGLSIKDRQVTTNHIRRPIAGGLTFIQKSIQGHIFIRIIGSREKIQGFHCRFVKFHILIMSAEEFASFSTYTLRHKANLPVIGRTHWVWICQAHFHPSTIQGSWQGKHTLQ